MSLASWLIAIGIAGWLLFLAFILLGARWNKEGDEIDRRMIEDHYRKRETMTPPDPLLADLDADHSLLAARAATVIRDLLAHLCAEEEESARLRDRLEPHPPPWVNDGGGS